MTKNGLDILSISIKRTDFQTRRFFLLGQMIMQEAHASHFLMSPFFDTSIYPMHAIISSHKTWKRLTDKLMCRIKFELKDVSVFIEEDWQKMFEFICQHVLKFEAAFKKPIKLLSRK